MNLRPYMSDTAGEPLLYSLYALVVHSGDTCLDGHFFCYTKVKSNFFLDRVKYARKTNFLVSVTGKQGFWETRSPSGLIWTCFGVLFVQLLSLFGVVEKTCRSFPEMDDFLCRPAMDYGTRWMMSLWIIVASTQFSGSKPTCCSMPGNN